MKKPGVSVPDKVFVFVLCFFLSLTHKAYSNDFSGAAFGAVNMAQQQTIGGKVTSTSGESLPGVNVIVKNSKSGTITDSEGNFSLTVPSQEAVLVFSFIGYLSEEITVGTSTNIDVQLAEDITSLSEVVVIGYGTQKKTDLSGSVSQLSAEEMKELPVALASEALRGRTSGVYVTTKGGEPGEKPNILIRGQSSISASNDPLIIVDGIPGSRIEDVNFNDVLSFNVLKDAASAAIYGSAGANGVILIETKKGLEGKPKFEFGYYTGIQKITKTLDVLSSQDYYSLLKEYETDGKLDPYFSDKYRSRRYYPNGTIDTNNLVKTNWQDEIFRVAPIHNINLSVSGGTQNTKFRLSGGYHKQDGIVKETSFERFNFRSNIDHNFNKKLSGKAVLAYSRREKSALGTSDNVYGNVTLAALQSPPLLPVYDTAGQFFINPFNFTTDLPLATIENSKTGKDYENSIDIMAGLTYKIFDGLTYRINFTSTQYLKKSWSYASKYHTYNGRQDQGKASSEAKYDNMYEIQSLLSYQKSFGNHNIDVLAGYINQQRRELKNFVSSTIMPEYYNDDYYNVDETIGNLRGESGIKTTPKRSGISRLSYNYSSKYIAQFNFRADGSKKFGDKNKYGYFPSMSLAWNLAREGFMTNVKAVNNLKIRASIGRTGNDNIDGYKWVNTYESGTVYLYGVYDEATTAYLPGITKPNLAIKWETSTEVNLGFDISVLDNKVSSAFDLYKKNTVGLLYDIDLPRHTGYEKTTVNGGLVEVKGWEFELTTHNISNIMLRWSTSLTLSHDENVVSKIPDEMRLEEGSAIKRGHSTLDYPNAIIEGQPIDVLYGYVAGHIITDPNELEAMQVTLPDGSTRYYQVQATSLGDIYFKDISGYEKDDQGNYLKDASGQYYKILDEKDKTVIGNPYPKYIFGLNNTFSYKNWDLSVFLQGVYDIDIYNATQMDGESYTPWFNQLATVKNRYPYGDQSVPRADWTRANNNNRTSTRYIEDASYLRVKNVTLSYTLPETFSSRLKLDQLKFYVTATNLMTFTNYSGFDPESANNQGKGVNWGGYPVYRTYTIGCNLTF
ncbi:MAG: TonB-dependent receptor [Bacteroidales bacterium]|nr:TonB-dependent receptor [Bacteroidales bacterium]